MTTPHADLHAWVVEEVLRRLRNMGARSPQGLAPITEGNAVPMSPTPSPTHSQGHSLGQLVTLESLRTLPIGTRSVILVPRSVVTPAARDELRKRGIEVLRDGVATTAGRPTAGPWLFAATCPQFDKSSVSRSATSEWSPHLDLVAVVQHVSEWLVGSAAGPIPPAAVIYAQQPALAACLLNRHSPVRAIVASELRALQRDLRAVNPNVLVVDLRLGKLEQTKRVDAFTQFVGRSQV